MERVVVKDEKLDMVRISKSCFKGLTMPSYKAGISRTGPIFIPRFFKASPEWKVTMGQIMSFSERGSEHTATTEEGDSGSPVIDENGVVVGVHIEGFSQAHPNTNASVMFTQSLVAQLFSGTASAGQK